MYSTLKIRNLLMTLGDERKMWWGCLTGLAWMQVFMVNHRGIFQAFGHSWIHYISCAHEPETKSIRMNRSFVRDMMAMEMRQSVALLLKMTLQTWVWSTNR